VGAEVKEYGDVEVTKLTNNGYSITKSGNYDGLYLEEQWENGTKYKLEYDLKCTEGELKNIGCHAHFFG
jgi:hypothetical protein